MKRLDQIVSRTESCLPFENDNKHKQNSRISKVRGDNWLSFQFFAHTYFPHVVELPFSSVHRYMFNIVDTSGGVVAVTGFRGLGKSAIFAFIYPVWKIIKGERYVIYGASNIEQSTEKAEFIAHEFTNNKRLLNDFPELKIKDSYDNIYFLQNNTKISAVSIKQSIRGTVNSRCASRPGLIILDDIDEEINIGNISIVPLLRQASPATSSHSEEEKSGGVHFKWNCYKDHLLFYIT